MRPCRAAAAVPAPPRSLIWPAYRDLLTDDEQEQARRELEQDGVSPVAYEAHRRVRRLRLEWTRQHRPDLSDGDLERTMRRIFARPLPGREKYPAVPLLPSWNGYDRDQR